jgi:hypothetical protein
MRQLLRCRRLRHIVIGKCASIAEIERLGSALREAETVGIPWIVDEAA